MDLQEKYYHWFIGGNNFRNDKPQYIANMEIGIVIRFELGPSMNAEFEEFYESIADVQFVHGERPEGRELEEILIDAYNYMLIEDRLLEQDIEDIEREIEDDDIVL